MPTFANFKSDVAAFANRTTTALTIGGRDMILAAANMAKAEAQRRHNFKLARADAYLSTSLAGASLSSAKTTPGGATAIDIKIVERAWLYQTVGASYYKTFPISAITVGDQKLYYPAATVADISLTSSSYVPQSLVYWIRGSQIFLSGTTTPQPIVLEVIQWLPDYDGSNSDFILERGWDWLFWRTMDYLNYLLKDDDRLPVASGRLEQAWNTLVAFDEDYAERGFDITASD